jgi:hypothetical protein
MKGEPKFVMTRLDMPKRCMMSWMNSIALAALYFHELFVLDPLGELVNSHKDVLEAVLGFLERSYLI